ncbi:MAG TPA: bifunctional nuclease family protein [Thermoanaerobaculia bacterium]|nr:bifunctional nuclease family protein [Thermoanaerobaculia bacterium]
MSQLVPMSIKGLMLDPVSNSPIVVLKDEEEKFFLPIWVGIFEANAIALQLENVETPRPMTHDLLRTAIGELGARVTRIVINDLRDSTFFAQIRILTGGKTLEVDARPSDAIALALRTEAPIFVAQTVLDQAQTISPENVEEDDERSKKWLESLDTEDLGKYKM